MGGAQAGEIAARIAASVLRDSSGESGEAAIVALIQEANRRVYEAAATDETQAGMGTTVTAAVVEEDAVRIGHVGDSRAYRIRDGKLEQLTDDHSLVAELVRSGKLSPEEADVHPQRSVITRVLGTDPDVDVDTFAVEAQEGDIFMLCSDGLTSMVDDKAILGLVEGRRGNLDKAARALVDAANKGGGEDNITVILFEVGRSGLGGHGDAARRRGAGRGRRADADRGRPGAGRGRRHDVRLARGARGRPPRPAAEARGPPKVLLAVAAVTSVAILAALVVWSLSRSYFVGVQPDGHVAIYQGFPWNLVGSVKLYRVRYESTVLAGQLSQAERRKLFDHDLRGYDRALGSVKRYEAEIVP